jgi:hypothetical protein
MAKLLRTSRIIAGLMVGIATGGRLPAAAQTAEKGALRCTCADGRTVQAGAVSYSKNSDRETITRIEPEGGPAGRCKALWIGASEIRAIGTPWNFHLERTALRERRIHGCDYPSEGFATRTKTYQFAFGVDSVPIRETGTLPSHGSFRIPATDPGSQSNTRLSNKTLWSSIEEKPAEANGNGKRASRIDATREWNRTSWILARSEISAHYVAVVRDAPESERLVPLKKTRAIKAGQLGQIEAVGAGRAIVRFYQGGRVGEEDGTGKFNGVANTFRRWYDRTGGPYRRTDEALYAPIGASILEVSLDDIIEVNDYLDQKQRDRT